MWTLSGPRLMFGAHHRRPDTVAGELAFNTPLRGRPMDTWEQARRTIPRQRLIDELLDCVQAFVARADLPLRRKSLEYQLIAVRYMLNFAYPDDPQGRHYAPRVKRAVRLLKRAAEETPI